MKNVNDYQQSRKNYTYKLFFLNQHLICHHIVNKSAQGEEGYFESFLLSCYTLVKPNKSVQPIAPPKKKLFLGVD